MKYLWLFIITSPLMAQINFSDNFSDSNVYENPIWLGDTSGVLVNSLFQLQLNAPSTEQIQQIYTHTELIDSTTWKFYTRMDFNPSSQNYLEIVLVNQDSLFFNDESLKLELGKSSDKLRILYNNTVLSESSNSVFTQSTNPMWFSISHLQSNWTVSYSSDSIIWNTLPAFQYSAQRNTVFGLEFHYTTTRRDKFYFDDLIISGYPFNDIVKPKLDESILTDSQSVILIFSEDIFYSGMGSNSFLILDSSSFVFEITKLSSDKVELKSNHLYENTPYSLSIKNLTDKSGNIILDTIIPLYWQKIYPYDLVINELMLDPSPPVYLPESEYVEIYNTSNNPINLEQCTLQIQSKSYTLPAYKLFPENHVVVYPDLSRSIVVDTLHSIFLENQFSLLNTKGDIHIKDSSGTIIHSVYYDESWYNDDNRNEGGWSLENKNNSDPCLQIQGWEASQNNLGGTPGKENSEIYTEQSFENKIFAFAKTDSSLSISFPYLVLDDVYLKPNLYTSSLSINNINRTSSKSLEIMFSDKLEYGEVYHLVFDETLGNCSGYLIQPFSFGLTGLPNETDVELSEICFNTSSTHSEFIEFKNNSNNAFDLYDFGLGVYSDSVWVFQNITDEHIFIPPHFYIVLVKNKSLLEETYTLSDSCIYFEMENWKSLPDKVGELQLTTRSFIPLDSLCYNENWHALFINDVENVSLEKIDLSLEGCNGLSWTSASKTELYATPGFANSQSNTFVTPLNYDKSFSPNGDGVDDFWTLDLAFDTPDSRINAFVYNLNGIKEYTYAKRLSVGSKHTIVWNGENDNSELLEEGTYIVVVELIQGSRVSTYFKEAVSILE